MSSRTRLLPLAGVLAVLGACGQPPRPLPTSPPITAGPSAGLPSPPGAGQPVGGLSGNPPGYQPASPPAYPPGLPPPGQPNPGLPNQGTPNPGVPNPGLPNQGVPNPGLPTANPTPPALPPGTAVPPATRPAGPTPTHAARCAGEPTGAQILTLLRREPGIPRATLRIVDGPRCSGGWSFSTVAVAGDEVEPLMVMTTGRGTTLDVVAAGSEVCTPRVQREAPPAVRVLACGF